MSAYQVLPDTIDIIVATIVELSWHRTDGASQYATPYHEREIETDTPEMAALVEESYSMWRMNLPIAHDTADIIGRELVAANILSLAARYGDVAQHVETSGMIGQQCMVSYWPHEYNYRRVERGRFANYPHALAAMACYDYQACERGGNSDRAYSLILRQARANCIRGITNALPDEVQWGNWSHDYVREQHALLRGQSRTGFVDSEPVDIFDL